jgi:hypothetical protein
VLHFEAEDTFAVSTAPHSMCELLLREESRYAGYTGPVVFAISNASLRMIRFSVESSRSKAV